MKSLRCGRGSTPEEAKENIETIYGTDLNLSIPSEAIYTYEDYSLYVKSVIAEKNIDEIDDYVIFFGEILKSIYYKEGNFVYIAYN